MNPIKPVTTKENLFGQEMADVSRHPAFGMLRIGRVNGSQVLFGSEVMNSGYIEIEVDGGEEKWRLSEKGYSSNGKTILRLAMSYSQFAEAITNQNTSGVPCTLEYVNGERVPGIKENTLSVGDQIKLDIKKQAGEINGAVNELRGKILGSKVSKKELTELLSSLDKIGRELNSNLPFIIDQCEEAVEHITTRSKIEVEAFARGRIRELGMEALADKQLKALQ